MFASPARVNGAADEEGFTVVIRNIDYRELPVDVKLVLDEVGLRGTFCYIYIPKLEVGRNMNVGYALVRFRRVRYAHECSRLFDGEVFGAGSTRKLCKVEAAQFQGDLHTLLRRQGRVQHGEPQVLVCEDRMPFDDRSVPVWIDAASSLSADDMPDIQGLGELNDDDLNDPFEDSLVVAVQGGPALLRPRAEGGQPLGPGLSGQRRVSLADIIRSFGAPDAQPTTTTTSSSGARPPLAPPPWAAEWPVEEDGVWTAVSV